MWCLCSFFFFKQKTAYEMRISDWSSDVCSSDLHDLAFLCNSGYEYENLGAEEALKAAAPKPAETHFWLHLGANVAARDWHEGLFGLAPLAGVDSQRYLVVSPPLLPAARRLFAGLAGLESPYPNARLSAGELTRIIPDWKSTSLNSSH